jgi:type VI secretion system protein ImpL
MSKLKTEEQKVAYQRLAAILDSIKKYSAEVGDRNKPWYILLGCKNAGRSQLLASLTESWQKFSINKQATAWIANSANYFEPEPELLDMSDNSREVFWDLFGTWLRKNLGNNAFSGCYAFIDTSSIYTNDDTALENIASELNKQIAWLQQTSNNTPIHLIISKADRIPGLNEYASNLDIHQRESKFGFPLDNINDHEHLNEAMTLFDLLVQSITNRIFIILQQCDEKDKKLIVQFPVQMQFIKQKLYQILQMLDFLATIKEISFISCVQQLPTQNLASKVALSNESKPSNNNYFIKQVFLFKGLPRINNLPPKINIKINMTRQNKTNLLVGIVLIALILTGAFLLSTIKKNNNVAKSSYQFAIQPSELSSTIQQLDNTYNILKNDNSWRNLWLKWADRKKHREFIMQTQQQYRKLLQQNLLPYILSRIGNNLVQGNNVNLAWDSLKLYQMLNDPSHRNVAFASTWINETSKSSDSKYNQSLVLHLGNLLKDNSITNTPSSSIYNQANQALNQDEIANVVYNKLAEQWQKNINPAFANFKDNTDITWINPNILDAMREKNVAIIFNTTIPAATNNILQEANWVLAGTNISAPAIDHLNIAIQILYLNDYNKTWQGIINGIKVNNSPNNDKAWQELADSNSSFWQNLNVVIDNIKPVAGITNFNKTIGKYFSDLSSMSTSQIQQQLTTWNTSRNSILSDDDNYKTAFNYAKSVMVSNEDKKNDLENLMQLGQTAPAPVGNIITQLAQQDWQNILAGAKKYINYNWHKTVYTAYENTIVNKYPIFNSDKDMSIQEFNNFFGPGGIIDKFFNNYINPFLTTHSMHWTISTKYNTGLSISTHSLDVFVRSALLQTMFFSNGKPGFQFSLTPVSFSQNTTVFIVNISGQMVQVVPGDKTEFTIDWPGPDPTFTTVRFSNAAEANPTITKTGPWSLFRVLDISHLKATNSMKNYSVTFAIGDDAATFDLNNPQLINPFIPDVLHKFRLTDKLD